MRDLFDLNRSPVINVTDGSFNSASLELDRSDPLPYQFTGTVTNSVGGALIANAFVAVYDATGTFIAGDYTDANGAFAIDLPDATGYEAFASAVGFSASATHVFDIQGTSVSFDFSLAAYTDTDRVVYGKIFDDGGLNPISGARVDVVSDAGVVVASTTTIADGEYSVPNLEEGDYSLVVSMTGYNIARVDFTIAAPDLLLVEENVSLITHEDPTTSTISGIISDSDGAGIADAWVGLYSSPAEALLKTTSTNSDGYYSFEAVENGAFLIKSKAIAP